MSKQICLLCVTLLAVVMNALASGSYRVTMPRPKTETKSTVDRDKYALGQQVFNGKARLTAQADVAAQKARLEKCQARLPEAVAKSNNLTALAGQLSDEQLAALEYYVSQRYPVRP